MKLAAVRKLAMSLPEVTEAPHHDFSSFRVRGKIFVTMPPDEKHVHVFVNEAERGVALAEHPDFIEELTWGGKVVGLRITLANADSAVVGQLVIHAWHAKAPKGLLSAPRKARRKR